jgi:lysylphosphatidylglycerol synthetase-like protein (DUF2156 family)
MALICRKPRFLFSPRTDPQKFQSFLHHEFAQSRGCEESTLKAVEEQHVLERLRAYAFNSSHFVWLISNFRFLESTTGWIFAVTRKFGVNLIALEPLPSYEFFLDDDFLDAMEELRASLPPGPTAFVAIGSKFASLLNLDGFYNLQIGKEPWVRLGSHEPVGNRGKGVRAARNQAIRAGITVENWKLSDVHRKPELRARVDEIHEHWLTRTSISLEGFLLKTNPWKLMDDRCCFLARNEKGQIEGVLIATPITSLQGWYLEDMWLAENHARGIGELLTLESMRFLNEMGSRYVSLGLIPMTDLNFGMNDSLVQNDRPRVFSIGMWTLAKILKTFYNADGLVLFRKRFNVEYWSSTFVSVRVTKKFWFMKSIQWLQVMVALLVAHRPKFYFNKK